MTIGSTGPGEISSARALARTALAVDPGRFDAEILAKAKICLLDFLSCAFEARNHPWSRQAVGIARETGDGATIIGTRTLASPGDAAFANADHGPRPGARRHARRQHLPSWRGDLADPARLGGTDNAARYDVPWRRDHRLRGRRTDRPRADYRRSRPPLPADRPCCAARRSDGGKLCTWPHRRSCNQRSRHCRQHIVRPEPMAAHRRLRDVFPSRLCRAQRDCRNRTRRGRRS